MTSRGRGGAAVVLGLAIGTGVCAAQPGSTPAAAPQDGLPATYLQVGPAVTAHGAGEQYHRASPALTGTTVGVALGVGARYVPELAVEGEIVLDGTLSGAVADVYSWRTDYTAESRDVLIGVNLRFRPRGGSHLEFAAGGGWAASRFARRDIVETRTFPPGVMRHPDTETSVWQPTVSGSMALALAVSPRLEIVPSIGARWIRRGFDTEAWYFGLGRFMVLAGASLRLRS